MRMKLLASAAAMALATPAFAADLGYVPPANDPVYSPTPMMVGHVELSLGYLGVDGDGDTGFFDGAGRVNIPFAGSWNLEVEAGGTAFFDDDYDQSVLGAYAHLWTNLGAARVGAFGGIADAHDTVGTIGLEGEVDVTSNATLGAQVAYNFVDGDDGWGLRGWADYYFAPNTKANLELAWADTDGNDAWGISGKLEHRFDNTPVSAFAEVGYLDADQGAEAYTVKLGTRIFLDQQGMTLQDHDRQVPFDFLGF